MAMIISFELLAYCIVTGAIYLLIVDFLWSRLENYVPTFAKFPAELVEKKNLSWFFSCFIIEFIFFVLIPSVVYGWFYTIIPFSGFRGGVAVGFSLFLFGMIPLAMLILFRIRIPAVYVLYQLLGLFFKLIGSFAVIGYLYSL
jgi:hypothetical protein